MVRYIYGDIIEKQKELEIDIICHQVNCQGKMGSGVAKRIRNAYPIVYTNYMKKCEEIEKIVQLLEVDELHVFDKNGVLVAGTKPQFYGMSMYDSVVISFHNLNMDMTEKDILLMMLFGIAYI